MNGHFLLGDIHPVKYFFTFAIALGLVFFFISPAENVHWTLALLQWQLQAIIPISLLILSHLLLAQWHWFQVLGHWYRLIISGVLGSALTAPFALMIEVILVSEPWPENIGPGLLDEWTGMGVPVIISWLLMNAPILMGFEYRKHAIQQHSSDVTEENQQDQSDFLRAANLADYTDIMALSSELHYLDVITKDEHQLILYSLTNAIQEMPVELGIQVHRSHWVAYQAVDSLNKQGRQGSVTLTNGKEIPVSRGKMTEVKSALSNYLN